MAERLKQIWSGFAETTTRNLTGRGVENIVVPHQTDWQAEDEAFVPEDFNAPAHAAFAALHERLAKNQKKFGRKKQQKNSDASGSLPELDEMAFDGGAELVKGLKETALRVERTEMDYGAFLKADGGKSLQTLKRKKRFGLF